MKKEQVVVEGRKLAILDHLKAHHKATVNQLCDLFGVSSATIRNDLRDLEENRLVTRTHGGATVRDQARFEPDAEAKAVQNMDIKQAIARAALDMIDDGDTLIIDAGSTTYELVGLLAEKSNLTIITNDLMIAMALESHPSAVVHLLGGAVRKRLHCTVGPNAEEMLKNLKVDKAFMGANSFSLEVGASSPDLQQSALKRKMMASATKVFFLVGSSKIGKNSFAVFATIDDVDCLITDAIAESDRLNLEENGVQVVIAPM